MIMVVCRTAAFTRICCHVHPVRSICTCTEQVKPRKGQPLRRSQLILRQNCCTHLTGLRHQSCLQGNVQPQQELGGQALVPDMMYNILDIFNPHNAKLTSAAAAGELTAFCAHHCCTFESSRLRNQPLGTSNQAISEMVPTNKTGNATKSRLIVQCDKPVLQMMLSVLVCAILIASCVSNVLSNNSETISAQQTKCQQSKSR